LPRTKGLSHRGAISILELATAKSGAGVPAERGAVDGDDEMFEAWRKISAFGFFWLLYSCPHIFCLFLDIEQNYML
jgi:hypothetical protein